MAFGEVMHMSESAPAFASPRSGPTDGLGDAPSLPVGSPTRGMTQPGAGDLDAEDLAGVGHDEVTDPLGERGLPPWHRMLTT